jgi:hypothetical protein
MLGHDTVLCIELTLYTKRYRAPALFIGFSIPPYRSSISGRYSLHNSWQPLALVSQTSPPQIGFPR